MKREKKSLPFLFAPASAASFYLCEYVSKCILLPLISGDRGQPVIEDRTGELHSAGTFDSWNLSYGRWDQPPFLGSRVKESFFFRFSCDILSQQKSFSSSFATRVT